MMVTLLLLFFKLGKFDTLTVSFSIIFPQKMYLSHAINMFFFFSYYSCLSSFPSLLVSLGCLGNVVSIVVYLSCVVIVGTVDELAS